MNKEVTSLLKTYTHEEFLSLKFKDTKMTSKQDVKDLLQKAKNRMQILNSQLLILNKF